MKADAALRNRSLGRDTLTSHLALVGLALRFTSHDGDLEAIPLRHSIAHGDCVKIGFDAYASTMVVIFDGASSASRYAYKWFDDYTPIAAYRGEEGSCLACEKHAGSQHGQKK